MGPLCTTCQEKTKTSRSLSLAKIVMPRLPCMIRRALLSRKAFPTDIAQDAERGRIGKVMLRVQHPAQLHRLGQDLLVRGVEDLGVELGRGVGAVVGRIAGAEGDGVVVDAAVDEDAAAGPALVEAVDAQRLHVDGADLDLEVAGEDVELDGAAPGVGRADPAAVVVGRPLEHDGRVGVRVGVDVLGDDGAEGGHVVVGGAEEGAVEGAEEAGVVVRHDAEEEGGAVAREREFGRVESGGFAG